jgi:cytidine deaminase
MIPEDLIQEMAAIARKAAQSAYCPYSNFRVGAALLTAENEIVSGCNVENASYGLTICAERTAVFRSVAQGWRSIQGIVVLRPSGETSTI